MFCMARAVHAPEITCYSRKQKLYRLNWPLRALSVKRYFCMLLTMWEKQILARAIGIEEES